MRSCKAQICAQLMGSSVPCGTWLPPILELLPSSGEAVGVLKRAYVLL